MTAATTARAPTSLPWVRGIVFTVWIPGTIAVYVPMRIATGLTLAGGFLQLGWLVSGAGALGFFVWLGFHLVVVLLEEPHLRDERGAAYAEYCRRVPR